MMMRVLSQSSHAGALTRSSRWLWRGSSATKPCFYSQFFFFFSTTTTASQGGKDVSSAERIKMLEDVIQSLRSSSVELPKNELPQAGLKMTIARRNIHLAHEARLSEYDKEVKSHEEKITELRLEQRYAKAAFGFTNNYISTGSLRMLVMTSSREKSFGSIEAGAFQMEYYETMEDFKADFRKDLLDKHFAKYGFEFVDSLCSDDPNPYNLSPSVKLEFRLKRSENSDKQEENDDSNNEKYAGTKSASGADHFPEVGST